MANKKNKTQSSREQRRLRAQQIIFVLISLIIVLAMVLSLLINY